MIHVPIRMSSYLSGCSLVRETRTVLHFVVDIQGWEGTYTFCISNDVLQPSLAKFPLGRGTFRTIRLRRVGIPGIKEISSRSETASISTTSGVHKEHVSCSEMNITVIKNLGWTCGFTRQHLSLEEIKIHNIQFRWWRHLDLRDQGTPLYRANNLMTIRSKSRDDTEWPKGHWSICGDRKHNCQNVTNTHTIWRFKF